MPNTAKTTGKNVTRTFTKLIRAKQTTELLDILDIRDDESHDRAVMLAGMLMDATGDQPEHPLYRLTGLLAEAIERYEASLYPPPETTPAGMLRFLMEQRNLKQTDLKALLGSQGVVSEILNGKREMNLQHIRKLAAFFHVDPAVFIERVR